MAVFKLHKAYQTQNSDMIENAAMAGKTKEALQRLCGFYGGSEHEILERLISDLERETLATLQHCEREDYFSTAA